MSGQLAVLRACVAGCVLVVLAAGLGAENIPINVVGATETQIIINYTATTQGPCAVSAIDQSGPSVNDLDPKIFPHADQDLNRTAANGFRWPTIVDDLRRTVIVGGHDEVKQGSDGKWYSTALQTSSSHTIKVACNSGLDTGTIQVSTANIPLGSNYPELVIPDANAPLGGLPQPTIDWASHTQTYIDPISGLLIQPASYPVDNFGDAPTIPLTFSTPVLVLDGQWTNQDYLITSQSGSTLASTTTANASLFAAFNPTFTPEHDISDAYIVPFGNASPSSITTEWCISVDSGQSCANYTPQSVAFSTLVNCYPTGNCATSIVPSGSPASWFADWGGMRVPYGGYDILNRAIPGVTASGSTVTIDNPSTPGFNLDRKRGSKFRLAGCSGGPDITLTVDTINSYAQITTRETGLSLQHCTYVDFAAGIRLVKTSPGTLNASFTAVAWQTRSATAGSSGTKWLCSPSKVEDVQTDCDGKAHNPPISGFLCALETSGIYLLQEDGRICLQSNKYGISGGHAFTHIQSGLNADMRWLDSRTVIGPDFQSPPHLWKATHVPNNYTAYPPDPHHSITDNFAYTDVTNLNPIGPQLLAQGSEVGAAVKTGLWPQFGLDTTFDNGNGGMVLQWRSQQSQDSPCLLAWTDALTNNLLSSLAMYGSYPFSYSACHFSGVGAGGYSLVASGAESGQTGAIFFNTGVLLGGPFASKVTALRKNGSFINWSLPIDSCTSTTPAVCTSIANDLDNVTATNATQGVYAVISGASGSWAQLNGPVYLHKIDNNTFSVYTDALGASPFDGRTLGAFTGGAVASVSPPVYNIHVNVVTNNGLSGVDGSGYARITADTSLGYAYYYPSGRLVAKDGDPLTIISGGSQLNSTTQYYAKSSCTGCSPVQFDIYTDSTLSTPASYSDLSGATLATFAEACPARTNVVLPGPMYTDTTAWDSNDNPKIRCFTIRLVNEPESDFASPAEHRAYPPPPSSAEYVNTRKSMLHQINPGDGVTDLSHFGNNHEIGYVVAVDRSAGENQIDVTIVRGYGDDPAYGWRGSINTPSRDSWAFQHAPGWAAWAVSAINAGLVDVTTFPAPVYVPPDNGSHHDFVPGSSPHTLTTANAYAYRAAPDDMVNVTALEFATPGTFIHNSMPNWAGGAGYDSFFQQSYPNGRLVARLMRDSDTTIAHGAVAPRWKADVSAMNGSFGYAQNNEDGNGWTRTLTRIRGTVYDPDNITSIVYKIPPQTSINIKLTPLVVENVPHAYFADKSGPHALITDADAGKYCVAYTAGECRPGSATGDIFFAGRGFYDAGQCLSNAATVGSPCAFGLWPGAGWSLQVMQTPVDTAARGTRRLTLGYWTPPQHWSFQNWIPSPDGRWGFQVFNPVNQRPSFKASSGASWFAFKLPPWPTDETAFGDRQRRVRQPDRTNFVPIEVSLNGAGGDTVRIAFGYGENGDPGQLYCTTRRETCWTSATATLANPFVFDSEDQKAIACDSGCKVTIYAIPGRLLLYQVERTNGSSKTTESLQVMAVP